MCSQISVMVMWRLAAGKDHVACPMLTCPQPHFSPPLPTQNYHLSLPSLSLSTFLSTQSPKHPPQMHNKAGQAYGQAADSLVRGWSVDMFSNLMNNVPPCWFSAPVARLSRAARAGVARLTRAPLGSVAREVAAAGPSGGRNAYGVAPPGHLLFVSRDWAGWVGL